MSVDTLTTSELQGGVWPGFLKPNVAFVFLNFNDTGKMREWLAEIEPKIATADKVREFNKRYKLDNALTVSWMNVGITAAGMELLVNDAFRLCQNLGMYEPMRAYLEGGFSRSVEFLGDRADGFDQSLIGRPDKLPQFVLNLAADKPEQLTTVLDENLALAEKHKCVEMLTVPGAAIRKHGYDEEHFGFKDGVSQPRPKTLIDDEDGGDVEPGEFVLGLSRERRENESAFWTRIPEFMKRGSFQVFRKLQQSDKWHEQAEQLGTMLGLSNLDVEQQMVGRTKQGELLEILQDFCHVRKMRSGDKLRKILRRGIPYEHSGEKGLLFNAYMADIESQFEFLQKSWANDFNKPVDRCGIDPIIGCSANPFIDWDRPGYIPKEHAIEKFVTTRGSVYAFVPSKSTLRAWSS